MGLHVVNVGLSQAAEVCQKKDNLPKTFASLGSALQVQVNQGPQCLNILKVDIAGEFNLEQGLG